MKMRLKRLELGRRHTFGNLSIDGEYECMTLEDVVRADGVKVPGETAIPKGVYGVEITYSPRFKRMLPLINGVKGFTAIRIHPGNTVNDTEGCILVGDFTQGEQLRDSRKAFDRLFAKIDAAIKAGRRVTLEVL